MRVNRKRKRCVERHDHTSVSMPHNPQPLLSATAWLLFVGAGGGDGRMAAAARVAAAATAAALVDPGDGPRCLRVAHLLFDQNSTPYPLTKTSPPPE